MGRQATKTVNSALTRFIYSGLQRIADYNGAGSLLYRYIFGVTLDEPLWAESSSSVVTYLTADETGSIVLTTNSSGGVVSQTAYDPFGHSSSVDATNFGFTGQRFDPETGFYFYKARYYSPRIGRFLQNDPVGYAGGDLNLYGYVNNSPLNLFDPLGLSAGFGGYFGGGLVAQTPIYDYSQPTPAPAQPASAPLQGFANMFMQPAAAAPTALQPNSQAAPTSQGATTSVSSGSNGGLPVYTRGYGPGIKPPTEGAYRIPELTFCLLGQLQACLWVCKKLYLLLVRRLQSCLSWEAAVSSLAKVPDSSMKIDYSPKSLGEGGGMMDLVHSGGLEPRQEEMFFGSLLDPTSRSLAHQP